MLKGRIKGIYLRGEIYWFEKQVNGRRSVVSLETRDYAEAVQRAREIMERPELQPAQALMAEVERFLKYKYETNRFSRTSRNSVGPGLDPESQFGRWSPRSSTAGHRLIHSGLSEGAEAVA